MAQTAEEIREKKRQRQAIHRASHRDKFNAAARAYKAAHRDKINAAARAYAAAHRKERLAYSLAYNAAHREERKPYIKKYNAKYYASNREKVIKQSKNYYQENREKVIERATAYGKIYQKSHPEKTSLYNKKYRTEHRERFKSFQRASNRKYPDTARIIGQRRRARLRGADINNFTAKQWRDMKEHYKNCCVYCGKKQQRLTMDHITPLFKGGNHTLSNIVPACLSCNSKKFTGPPLVPVQPMLL